MWLLAAFELDGWLDEEGCGKEKVKSEFAGREAGITGELTAEHEGSRFGGEMGDPAPGELARALV